MESMRVHQFNGLVILGALILSGCASSPDDTINVPYSEVANAREHFIEMYNQAPNGLSASAAWANTDPLLRAFLNAYHVTTAVRPKEQGELHFRVIDEAGQPLDGVKSEVLGVSHPDLLAMEPTVSQRFITIDKEYRLKWPLSLHSIELKLSKTGYRPIYIQFNPQSPNDLVRYTMAMEMLEEGHVLPPRDPEGPVRIVLPPRVQWGPLSETESDDAAYRSVDRNQLPKRAPSDSRAVATSDKPRLVPAPVRGIYILVNKDGEIMGGVRLDRGNVLGFVQGLMAMTGGSGGTQDPTGAPYEWRLYSVAKPRIPASQP